VVGTIPVSGSFLQGNSFHLPLKPPGGGPVFKCGLFPRAALEECVVGIAPGFLENERIAGGYTSFWLLASRLFISPANPLPYRKN